MPPKPAKRLTDRDTVDHVHLLNLAFRIGPVAMLMLMAGEYLVWGPRVVWFIIPDIAATALIVLGASRGLDIVARGAGSILLPSGNGSPKPREYSEQEALIIRGRYMEAADSYRAIIEEEPLNIEAQLRLGAILERHLNDPDGAELCYREIRARRPTPQEEWAASNALIDLYQRVGKREPLKQELSRMARQYQDTEVGASARRRLQELHLEEGENR